MGELIAGVALFTLIVMALVAVILAARAVLVPRGTVTLTINGERHLAAAVGARLLAALTDGGILMPAACGGRGTCGQCRVRVTSGGGPALAVEAALLTRRERQRGLRLACQVTLRGPLELEVPEEILGVRLLPCRVASSRQVGTLLREIVLELPEGEWLDFRAGAYVQVTCPPQHTELASVGLAPPFDAEWERLGIKRLETGCTRPETRAYSIASHPGERGRVTLLVRLATPPPDAGPEVPPGVVSSWLFARRPGDEVPVAGPYGNFAVEEGDAEMVFVGGGAGLAPLRSMILDQLVNRGNTRRMSFWYGARSRRELIDREVFDRLAAEHDNFTWCPALSEPLPDDGWDGATGYIHEVLRDRYLGDHPAPEACEYYLCGPPLMIRAVRALLDELGVEREAIHYDDFGT